jgi:endonuclease/exonuclease/phosphatase (EEP) superfamily protein YafD
VLGALTLLALLGRLSAYFELLAFFRVQYAVLLLAAGVIALAVRSRRVALAAAALAALNLAIVAPTWTSPPARTSVGSDELTLLLLNLQSENDEHARVARLIEESDADVVGLLELTPVWRKELEPALSRFVNRRLEPEEGAYGIGLYSKPPLLGAMVERFPADGPPSVVARLRVGGESVTFVLTHVHTPFAGEIHRRQFEALADARGRLGERLAICGDLNAVPWSSSFRHLASDADLTDSHRGHWLDGSWPSWLILLRVPIDNCLVSDGLTVLEREHGPDVGSDHFPLIVRFGIAAALEAER